VGLVLLTVAYVVLDEAPRDATTAATDSEAKDHGIPTPTSSFDDSELGALEDLTVLGGTDVPAGTYRVVEAVNGDGGVNGGVLFDRSCKWGVYAGAQRGIDQILMANVTDGGHPVMRIADGQRAYSQNCGTWAPLQEGTAALDDLVTAMDDGYWTVGIDVAPGTYERLGEVDADDPDTWCVWTVLESFEPSATTVVQEFDFSGDAPRTVDLADGQVLSSSMCGGWQIIR